MGHGSRSPGFLSGRFIIIIIFYFFLVSLGLHCYMQAFSSGGKWGVLCCSTQASCCGDFSCCGSQTLGQMGFSGCRMWAQ